MNSASTDKKPAIKSKTNWLGLLIAVLPMIEWVKLEIAKEPWIVSILGVAIVVLRQLTSEGVTWKKLK